MLRLITEGPGWTDDTAFFRWVSKDNGQPRLIGYESSSGTAIIFTNQSFDDAVAALLSAGQWDNEDDGTSNYIEGDTPDLFNAVDWYEDDNATEEEFFEDAMEFDNVSDYLEQIGYSSEEDDENLYYYDDAVDYIEEHGISCDPGDYIGEYVCDLLDDEADVEGYDDGFGLGGDSKYSQETLDSIIRRARKKQAEYEEDRKEDELSEYALSKKCEGFEDLENSMDEDEIKEYIDNVYDCIFGGGYYNEEDTTFILHEEYIEIFVNGKSEGKFEIFYDRSVGAYRLYDYND